MTIILDGNKIAEEIKSELKEEINKLGLKPQLDVILVGHDGASEIYVQKKCEACKAIGIKSFMHFFEEDEELNVKARLHRLNSDPAVSGILVQLPLPKEWNQNIIFNTINPKKDVDVFNPINVGLLVQNRPRFLPPTPHAVQQIFKRSKIQLAGKHVVVINRSNIVGKPLSSMLIQDNGLYDNATVTVCHNNTPPDILKAICLSSDMIVVAVGIPGFLTADMVHEKHVVIDVGITRIGKKIVGDVAPEVNGKVKYISKVPGGVGPVTVSMLLYNTLNAYCLQNEILNSPTMDKWTVY
jgi:methylenetetrahydrofolate dehydrogenase (NADP+)/methenyltetrahydrofolate cyclohydrolase